MAIIEATRPEELYELGTPEELKAQYRRLSSEHHPDKGGNTEDFQKVKELYEAALKKVAENKPWDSGKCVSWWRDSSLLKLNYLWSRQFEIGKQYVSNGKVLYHIEPGNEDLLEVAKKNIAYCRNIAGPNEKLAEVNSWILPEPVTTDVGSSALMLTKDEKIVPLRAVLDKVKRFEPVHAAWAIGRLMHILCMLEWKKLMHGDISVDSLYVNLENHSLHLYGGWWYSASIGGDLIALPPRSMRLAPSSMILSSYAKMGDQRIDFECARQVAIELLGASSATELRMMKDVPQKLADFLVNPFVAPTATDLYPQWEKARDAAFGKRKFIVFDQPSNLFN
jgi:hypothetical protein